MTDRRGPRRRSTLATVLAAALMVLTATAGRPSGAGAQVVQPPPLQPPPGAPKMDCNSTFTGDLYFPYGNLPPIPAAVVFDGAEGQIVDFTVDVRGRLEWNDIIGYFLYSPSGATMFPDQENRYRLPYSGTYTIIVTAFPQTGFLDGIFVPPRTVMAYTIWLRCSAVPTPPPGPTPTPAPTPPPPPTPTPTPEPEAAALAAVSRA